MFVVFNKNIFVKNHEKNYVQIVNINGVLKLHAARWNV